MISARHVVRALCGLLLVPATALAQLPYGEDFTAPDGSPWPAPWFSAGAAVTVEDIQSNRGRLNGNLATVARMVLPGYSEVDVEVLVTFEFENVAGQGIGFYVRQNGGTLQEYLPHGQGYALFLKGGWGWPEDLGIWREIDGVETQFATGYNPVPGGLQNNTRYRLRYRVYQVHADTTLLQARVWPEAGAEPALWNVEVFDTQPLLQGTAGGFAIDIYNQSGADHIFIDDILIAAYPPTVSVPPAVPPRSIALSVPRPHPSSGPTRIDMTLTSATHATLRAFDTAGRMVGEVYSGAPGAGTTSIVWTPVDPAGRRLRAGVYFLRLDAGGVTTSRRVVITD